MFSRRFVLLAGVLVTLNLALWFASPGLALRKALVNQLFGPKMIRVEVIKWTGAGTPPADIRLDRGVITQVSSTQLTLRERDTKVQSIPLSSATDVIRFGHHLPPSVLAKRWHVVVTWPANGAAQTVDVEKVPPRG
ncbi:MAG: hypothetical protein E6G16_08515 [Actinobacteria bacterium]|nr:MAG: hypothetical protein E6G16_08515 [Actinomycetota bacterium]